MNCKTFVLINLLLFLSVTVTKGFADETYYNKSYALVIGISKYTSIRWKNLPYARSDAAVIADMLRQKGFEVLTLFDRDATKHAILARLENNIAPRLNSNDRVLFYFSGHGFSQQKGDGYETYLIPYDKDNIEVNDSWIYLSMRDLMRQSKIMSTAKHQLFFIDAPVMISDKYQTKGIESTAKDYIGQVSTRKACQVICAGENKKTPLDGMGPVHNILSQLFFTGLKNGKADINGDGLATCLEIYSFIMPRATNLTQKPSYGAFAGHDMGEFIFSTPESMRKKISEEKELEVDDLTVAKKPIPVMDVQDGRLYIETVPKGARIRILNIVPPYRYGMMLSPGDYKIEVSKPGYQSQIKWLTIAKEDQIHETIILKSTRPFSRLYVYPEPEDAQVRVMNIVPPYSEGMALQAGRYMIEVSKPGYKSFYKWINIAKSKDCVLEPQLKIRGKQPKPKPKPQLTRLSPKKMDHQEIMESPLKPAIKTIPPLKPAIKTIPPQIKETTIKEQPKPSVDVNPQPKKQKKAQVDVKPQPKKHEKIQIVQQPETDAVPTRQEKKSSKAVTQPIIQEKKSPQAVAKAKKQEQPKTKPKVTPKPTTSHYRPTKQKRWQEPVTGMAFIRIAGGCYDMGCGDWTAQCDSDELPVHKVCVDDFWMGQYEVTQNEWEIIMGENPSLSAYGKHYPVEKVSWKEVQAFIRKLEKKSKHRFQLPTEAQWEFACRSGGQPYKYAGTGMDINHVGWFNENSLLITHSVGSKAPNLLDLFDMSGNVSEWCQDAYQSDAYKKHAKNNPVVRRKGKKVVRGGDWSDDYSHLRCADRRGYSSDLKSKDLGFRLIRLGK